MSTSTVVYECLCQRRRRYPEPSLRNPKWTLPYSHGCADPDLTECLLGYQVNVTILLLRVGWEVELTTHFVADLRVHFKCLKDAPDLSLKIDRSMAFGLLRKHKAADQILDLLLVMISYSD